MFDVINKLTEISPRYGHREIEAAKIITDELKSLNIGYVEEPFESAVPKVIKAELIADGKYIPCLGSSLISGIIKDGKFLISGFGYTGEQHPYNICYSPITDEISVIDIAKEPSLTISRNSVIEIVMANKVNGLIKVEKEKFTTKNIMVGNTVKPENIVFAHFDSIVGDGASDNGAAIAVLLEIVKIKPEILKNTLIVFAGNEEVSYDSYKTKSGYGFRVFELAYGELLQKAKQIIVIDGIGLGSPSFVQTGLDWVLQVKMLGQIRDKVFWLQNDQSEVLKYFHTQADTVDKLHENYMQEALMALITKIS
jgi:hypothetical protein